MSMSKNVPRYQLVLTQNQMDELKEHLGNKSITSLSLGLLGILVMLIKEDYITLDQDDNCIVN